MRILYNILAYLAMPVALIRLLVRSRRLKAYREHIGERFGFVPKASGPCLWFHAVSVGESIAAAPLVQRCREVYPEWRLVVTNTTPTGRERTRALLGDTVENYYFPYDIPGAIKRFISRQQPTVLVLMETELWPNLLYYTQQLGIQSLLANARMSARSASRYAAAHFLTKAMFEQVDVIAAQAAADRDRFIALGAAANNVHTVGSVKYDLTVPAAIVRDAADWRHRIGDRPIWVASSTHEGEEAEVLTAHQLIQQEHPEALLILVPRHPNRFDDVAASLESASWSFVRRSQTAPVAGKTSVLLGDTMGEMLFFYALADVAFVAGSFMPIGGHNTMEPAALAKPILQGPHWHNFAETTRLLTEANALIEVSDAAALAKEVVALFGDKTLASAIGARAKQVIDANRGSVDRQFALIDQLVSSV